MSNWILAQAHTPTQLGRARALAHLALQAQHSYFAIMPGVLARTPIPRDLRDAVATTYGACTRFAWELRFGNEFGIRPLASYLLDFAPKWTDEDSPVGAAQRALIRYAEAFPAAVVTPDKAVHGSIQMALQTQKHRPLCVPWFAMPEPAPRPFDPQCPISWLEWSLGPDRAVLGPWTQDADGGWYRPTLFGHRDTTFSCHDIFVLRQTTTSSRFTDPGPLAPGLITDCLLAMNAAEGPPRQGWGLPGRGWLAETLEEAQRLCDEEDKARYGLVDVLPVWYLLLKTLDTTAYTTGPIPIWPQAHGSNDTDVALDLEVVLQGRWCQPPAPVPAAGGPGQGGIWRRFRNLLG